MIDNITRHRCKPFGVFTLVLGAAFTCLLVIINILGKDSLWVTLLR